MIPTEERPLSQLEMVWREAEELVQNAHDAERRTKDPRALIDAQKIGLTRLQKAWDEKNLSHVTVWLDACGRLRVAEATPIVIELLKAQGPWTIERLCAADAARSVVQRLEDRGLVADLLYAAAPAIYAVHACHGMRALLGAVFLDNMSHAFERCLPLFERESLNFLWMGANALCGHLGHATQEERHAIKHLDRWEAALANLRENHRKTTNTKQTEGHTEYIDTLLLRILLASAKGRFLPLLLEDYAYGHPIVAVGAAQATQILLREIPSIEETLKKTPAGLDLLEGARFCLPPRLLR